MDIFNRHYNLDSTEGAAGALEGDYFRATNTTIGTGIVSSTTTAFSSTSALLVMSNGASRYNPRSAASATQLGSGNWTFVLGDGSYFGIPEYLRLTITAADVGATSFQWAIVLDSVNRYSSGGQIPTAPTIGVVNILGMGITSYVPKHSIQIGAVVTTAESGTTNPLHVSRGAIKTNAAAPLMTVGDEFLWTFTRMDNATAGVKTGTTPQVYRDAVGPCPIPPGGSLVLHAWYPGMTGAFSFEYEVGWSEMTF